MTLLLLCNLNCYFSQELPYFFYTNEFNELLSKKKVKELNRVFFDYDTRKTYMYDTLTGKRRFTGHYFIDNYGKIDMIYYYDTEFGYSTKKRMSKDSIAFKKFINQPYQLTPNEITKWQNYFQTNPTKYCSCEMEYSIDSQLTNYHYYTHEINTKRFATIPFFIDYRMKNILDFKNGKLNGAHLLLCNGDHWIPEHFKYNWNKINDTLNQLYFNYTYTTESLKSNFNWTFEDCFDYHYRDTSYLSSIYRTEINRTISELELKSKLHMIQQNVNLELNDIKQFTKHISSKNIKFEKIEIGKLDSKEIFSTSQIFYHNTTQLNKTIEYFLLDIGNSLELPVRINNTGDQEQYFNMSILDLNKNDLSILNSTRLQLVYKKITKYTFDGKIRAVKHYILKRKKWILCASEIVDQKTNSKQIQVKYKLSSFVKYLNYYHSNYIELYNFELFKKIGIIWFLYTDNYVFNYNENIIKSIINQNGNIILSVDDNGMDVMNMHFDFLYESTLPNK
jgi:hypothetical protein